MVVEVLVATMHQRDFSIVDKMNIRGNAIIVNQCNENNYSEINDGNRIVKMYSFNERGVGRSRNNALMRSTADICIMADDDVVYLDNYEEIVIEAFKNNPNADMIMFNVPSYNKSRDDIRIIRNSRVKFFNCLRYGTFNIAFKREKIIKANVFFSLLFGGGTRYGSGEDSLFILKCLKAGVKIYTDTSKIADVYHIESTWFEGFNDKFFFDKGALLEAAFIILKYPIALYFAIKFKRSTELSLYQILNLIRIGMSSFRYGYSFNEWREKTSGL